jgi:hypothetical protein
MKEKNIRIKQSSRTLVTRELNVKVVGMGIDTLELGYCIEKYDIDFRVLEEAKALAQSKPHDNDLGSVNICGIELKVNRAGRQMHEFVLQNGDITIAINRKADSGKHFPEVRVTFRSEYIWRVGWQIAVKAVTVWLLQWAVIFAIKVSRVDLALDLACPIPVLELQQFVTYARGRTDHYEIDRHCRGKCLTGYSIGKGDMLCRIYDKKREIILTKKTWFEHIWKRNGWVEDEPVTRIEFQFRRNILRELQVNDDSDLGYLIGDLWNYAVNRWLTVREIGDQGACNRMCRITEWWIFVQSVNFGCITGVTRVKQLKPKYEHSLSNGFGNLITALALQKTSLGLPTKETIARFRITIKERFLDNPDLVTKIEQRASKLAKMSDK